MIKLYSKWGGALITLLALVLALAGCSDSSDSDSSLSSSLLGTWEYTYVSSDNYYDIYTYVFNSDGTYTTTNAWGYYDGEEYSYTEEGTWSLSGSTLALTRSGSDPDYGSYTSTGVYTVSFSGNSMTLTLVSYEYSESVTDAESETWTRPSTYSSGSKNSMKEGDSITLTRAL